MADIAWNEHTSFRHVIAAEKILLLPTNSLTHRERAWLAKPFSIDTTACGAR